jgi:uncharacterized alpha-E superfamily protein
MLARLAENLFWAGRYVERAEDIALLLDVTYHGLLESPTSEASRAWQDLLDVLQVSDAFASSGRSLDAEGVSEFLVLEESIPVSIISCVARTRENGRSVRELVSSELWQTINSFYLDLQARDLHADLARNPHELYGTVKLRCQTIYGVASETMPRDDGWRFMMLGRMLERAEMTCRLLNVRYAQLTASPHAGFHDWVGVLKSASAFEAYLKSYRAQMDPAQVVEFLLFREDFPRSVLFCLRAAESGLAKLGPLGQVTRPQRLLGRIRAELEFRDIDELLDEGLHAFLDRVQEQVWEVADAVADQFFRHELRSDLELHSHRTA